MLNRSKHPYRRLLKMLVIAGLFIQACALFGSAEELSGPELRATLTEEGSENLGETVNVIDACQPGYEGVLGSVSETELFDLSQDLVSEYEDGMWSLGDISDQIQGYLNDFTITGDTSLKSAICEALQDNSNIVDTFIALQPVGQGNADSLSGGLDSEVVPPDSASPEPVRSQPIANQQNIPVYDATVCPGTDNEPHRVRMTDNLLDCLIEASKSSASPVVVAGSVMDPAVIDQVHEALNAGIEILGGWGPLHIVLVGVNDPDARMLAEHLCTVNNTYAGWPLDECITETTDLFSTYDCCGAAHNPPVPLAPVRLQSVQFSAPDISAEEGRLRTTTLHEYVHVFQNAQTVYPHELDPDDQGQIPVYGFGPVWMEEGSAEYLAIYFSGERGWYDFYAAMEENLRAAREVRANWGLSLRDVATRDGQARVNELCDCGGNLYYETGTWATAWLVNRSGIDAFLVDYFPRVSYDGWEVTFEHAFGLTMDEFYTEFDAFLELTIADQMVILPPR